MYLEVGFAIRTARSSTLPNPKCWTLGPAIRSSWQLLPLLGFRVSAGTGCVIGLLGIPARTPLHAIAWSSTHGTSERRVSTFLLSTTVRPPSVLVISGPRSTTGLTYVTLYFGDHAVHIPGTLWIPSLDDSLAMAGNSERRDYVWRSCFRRGYGNTWSLEERPMADASRYMRPTAVEDSSSFPSPSGRNLIPALLAVKAIYRYLRRLDISPYTSQYVTQTYYIPWLETVGLLGLSDNFRPELFFWTGQLELYAGYQDIIIVLGGMLRPPDIVRALKRRRYFVEYRGRRRTPGSMLRFPRLASRIRHCTGKTRPAVPVLLIRVVGLRLPFPRTHSRLGAAPVLGLFPRTVLSGWRACGSLLILLGAPRRSLAATSLSSG
ncbi:hypothetical protein BDZ89DRAFT_1123245 [Hymenopellis radicata]|nr:hypothetical protein BDZ89DRAFT_1123245 [Hymenopellis radicata]